MTKLNKKHAKKKTCLFIKNDPKMNFKVEPKIVNMPSRLFVYPTEKTLKSASRCFLHLLLSGTPGPSTIVQIPGKYNNFCDANLSQKKHTFLQKSVKTGPPATSNSTRNHKKLVLKTLENYVFFCYRFFHPFVGK